MKQILTRGCGYMDISSNENVKHGGQATVFKAIQIKLAGQ